MDIVKQKKIVNKSINFYATKFVNNIIDYAVKESLKINI